MSIRQTLGKEERLKSNLRIKDLLKNGRMASAFPLKVFWDIQPENQRFPACVAVSVPKKRFRKAVERNLLKRQIREAYRKNKEIIYEPLMERGMNINLVILFLQDEFITFVELEKNLKDLLKKIAANLP